MIHKDKTNKDNKVVVVASGYFSPIHSAHIEYLEKSKALGDRLVVVVNNDNQERMKKSAIFMTCEERMKIVRALRCVDQVVESIDKDRSICETLALITPDIFTNGGDQFNDNIPEGAVCRKFGIKMVDGLGDKKMSSSALIANAHNIKNYKKKQHYEVWDALRLSLCDKMSNWVRILSSVIFLSLSLCSKQLKLFDNVIDNNSPFACIR